MLVFLSPISNKQISAEEAQVIENDHLKNIGRLSESGVLANAGPFEGGGEFMLLNTNTRNDTEKLLQKDPAIQNGLFKMEILSMEFRKGGICKPDVPYEMKTFSFVRFYATNQIASYKTNVDFDMKRVHQNHLDYLSSSGNVLVEGIFPGNDGGIIIYKGHSLDDKIEDDPAIKGGYLKAETKTIWLNVGSFCYLD
jgi:uncharacterized protein YciI